VKATAALLREIDAPLTIEEIELDELQAGEVLVRIRGVGICHTDIAAQQGVIPLPLPTCSGTRGPASSRPWATASPAWRPGITSR